MPDAGTDALAETLCDLGNVAFLASEVPGDYLSTAPDLRTGNVVDLGRRSGASRARFLVRSREPAVVKTGFDDAGAPWWLRADLPRDTAGRIPATSRQD